MIEKIRTCHKCLQFVEDCECCKECGELDFHARWCDVAPTSTRSSRRAEILQRKAAAVEKLAATARGIGPHRPDTIRNLQAVVKVPGQDRVNGYEATTFRQTPVPPGPKRYDTLKVATPYPPATPVASTLPSKQQTRTSEEETLIRCAKSAGISLAQARTFMAAMSAAPPEQAKQSQESQPATPHDGVRPR